MSVSQKRLVVAAAAIVLIGLGAAYGLRMRMRSRLADMPAELSHRGRVAVVGGDELASLRVDGTTFVSAQSLPKLARALADRDARAVPTAMQEEGVSALLVDTRGPRARFPDAPVADRLRAFDVISTLRGVYLVPAAALYEPLALPDLAYTEKMALARIARDVLGGTAPPRLEQFPASMREPVAVEVMVLVRENGIPKLWRSARSSSIASGLLTALAVARERWTQREGALGAPLERELSRMDVEVSLLIDDGTIGARTEAFVDRVITPAHGVAFERAGRDWQYVLPEALHATRPVGGVEAFRRLFRENGIAEDSLGRRDMRLYRVRVLTLSVSRIHSHGDLDAH